MSSPASTVLGPDGVLARALPGYEHRQSQLDMADAVTRAFERDQVLLVEAGTGTGKTLAYLVPALLSGKKVVISTGTKALQDQIMEHDVPLLARVLRPVLGRAIDVACMKGLGNYLCLRRYNELLGSAQGEIKYSRELPMLRAWAQESELGDRSELSLAETSMIWGEVHSAADTRIGPKCAHHEACFVTKMRKRAQDADVVVVNHHLYFADLALRSGRGAAGQAGVIPEHAAVVFDEAHLIEDIATDFFGVSVSTTRLAVLVRDASRTLSAARLDLQAERLLTRVASTASNLFVTLPQAAGDGARVPLSRDAWSDRLLTPMLDLDSALDGLASFCKQHLDQGEAVAQIARRTDQVRNDIAIIAEGGGGGRVTWVISRGKGVSFGASPIDVADILRDNLFMQSRSVVLTSATLTTSGTFDYVRSRLGIARDAAGIDHFAPEERILASPFDFGAQAALYVPDKFPDPREPDYLDAAEREISELIRITGGGAFVLCTSLRVMRALGDRLARELELPVLVQGTAPHASLLERFRQHGNAVLVATASFWQGVDVPGHALRLVIMDKLPFDVPTDPLVAARCERLEQSGEKPFMKYLVPSAALTLKQGFGRLIRTAEDRGIVAILDSRLTKKGYGKTFISSLPPASRCYSLEELRAFYTAAMA